MYGIILATGAAVIATVCLGGERLILDLIILSIGWRTWSVKWNFVDNFATSRCGIWKVSPFTNATVNERIEATARTWKKNGLIFLFWLLPQTCCSLTALNYWHSKIHKPEEKRKNKSIHGNLLLITKTAASNSLVAQRAEVICYNWILHNNPAHTYIPTNVCGLILTGLVGCVVVVFGFCVRCCFAYLTKCA